MSAMAELDIVLSEHKLSDAQKNAVVELLGGGFTTAKPNTIKSLENKGLVINKGDFYLFEKSFKAQLKGAREVVTNQVMESVEPLESSLKEDLWKMGEQITADEAYLEFEDAPNPDTFDWQLGVYANTLMGFGDVYKWRNERVWDGLTAEEIRADMDTARPINRKARRAATKLQRKIVRQLVKAA